MNIWVLMRPLISFTYCRQEPQNQGDFVPQLFILKSPRGEFNEVSTITKVNLQNNPIFGVIYQVKFEIEQNPPSKPLPESPNLSPFGWIHDYTFIFDLQSSFLESYYQVIIN